ncbi:hypothetical protein VIM7927_03558 [Vibrio mangrovi]|uniref:Uncharacterized protein n=1 Tax=Vibrio mangrovi TaxID=474394 RepID=A0A1Y6IZI0_9VIBR|nr:hypothetical protein VIM7927_03558 [Vibrio mangrovi]
MVQDEQLTSVVVTSASNQSIHLAGNIACGYSSARNQQDHRGAGVNGCEYLAANHRLRFVATGLPEMDIQHHDLVPGN